MQKTSTVTEKDVAKLVTKLAEWQDKYAKLEVENAQLRVKIEQLESHRNCAMQAEKRDADRAFRTLIEVGYPTPVETYGTNASWAVSDLCRCISGLGKKIERLGRLYHNQIETTK